MARKLNRRRYAEATKYLKGLIKDDRQQTRIRLRAVESLVAIYAADDRAAERADAKEGRRLADAVAGETGTPAPEQREPETAEAFLARMRRKIEGETEHE